MAENHDVPDREEEQNDLADALEQRTLALRECVERLDEERRKVVALWLQQKESS